MRACCDHVMRVCCDHIMRVCCDHMMRVCCDHVMRVCCDQVLKVCCDHVMTVFCDHVMRVCCDNLIRVCYGCSKAVLSCSECVVTAYQVEIVVLVIRQGCVVYLQVHSAVVRSWCVCMSRMCIRWSQARSKCATSRSVCHHNM